jgi:hypothetical protein
VAGDVAGGGTEAGILANKVVLPSLSIPTFSYNARQVQLLKRKMEKEALEASSSNKGSSCHHFEDT